MAGEKAEQSLAKERRYLAGGLAGIVIIEVVDALFYGKVKQAFPFLPSLLVHLLLASPGLLAGVMIIRLWAPRKPIENDTEEP